jgi:hypothetical protein
MITMAVPSLDNEFMQYWSKLTVVQKQSLLSVIKSFAQPEEHISLEQYNKEIDEAEAEFEKGDYISHEEMIRQIKKW